MAATYELDVAMPCGGCASTVKKAVNAIPNVASVETSVEKQQVSVVVHDGVSIEDVKAAIVNAGKKVSGGRIIMDGQATEMA